MPIFIDNRGKGEAELAFILSNTYHLAVEVKNLKSGDIVFGDVGIERKTLNDLVSSVVGQTRHFWEQLKTLKNTYKYPFVLIEGPINWKDKWLSGVIFSVMLGWRVPIIPTYNLADSAQAIERLFNKYGPAKSGSYPAVVVKADTPERIHWAMLQCIRGIGPKCASDIMKVMNPFVKYEPSKLRGIRIPKKSKEMLDILFRVSLNKID